MVKFYEELPHVKAGPQHIVDHRILGALDVHFEQVDPIVPELRHERSEPTGRHRGCAATRSRVLIRPYGVRHPRGILGRIEGRRAVMIEDREFVETETLRKLLTLRPV